MSDQPSGHGNRIVDLIEDKSPAQEAEDMDIFSAYGLDHGEVREAVVWDVNDTFQHVLPQFMKVEEDEERAAMPSEVLAGVLATHSEVWFKLGLIWAREHGR